ncbi:ankyrin-3 [Prunus yedoensis var. nudiflora]|uniref:Ankyrin-3 n=1 Tax=Prunus yedoensis var. nudiflora TaxID=2094558 RepID=A0A314UD55_PRUYE|nr:ankyrin-3 [Prunus yedoensis var. nudiflora]
MDRLVKPDVKEVELNFKRDQKCSTTFRLSNLMHTMSVAVSLTTTNPSLFSFSQPFSIIPPLSSASYSLLLSQPSDQPPLPLSTPHDVINVKTSMLPTGKAHQDDLRRLFARPGPHVFRDATIPIAFVGPHVVEFLISQQTRISEFDSFFNKAISGCSGSDLTALLKPAIASGNANLVSDLIDAGAVVNQRNSDSGSLLSLGVGAGNVEIVKFLIASGCGIGNNSADMVLHEAAAINRVDLIEILCKSFAGIDLNWVDPEGRTPIHVAAAHGHVETLKFCISVGGNAEVSDCEGWSPLHCAAEKGHLEAAKCLLDCSNGKYAVTRDGRTAFDIAAANGHSGLLGVLRYDDVLHRAARLDDANGLKSCLAEGADLNGRDQNGWTPLHRAAFKGRIECVKVLLNHGAQVDVVDDAGYTPLHCAVEAGHVQVALLLVAHGARANVKSLEGVMPINLDRFKNHPALGQPLCHEKERA